jgi:hypothetical protein
MTGMTMMIAGAGAEPPTPLSASANIGGGNSSVAVSTASGSTTAIPGGGERFMSAAGYGGTPPYTFRWERQNGDNKTALESTSSSRAYVSWSDMLVGEYQSVTARCRVRDAAGNTAYSGTVVIGVTRAS